MTSWRCVLTRLVVGGMLALAGCHNAIFPPDVRLDPRSASKTGLLVVGYRILREPVGYHSLFGQGYNLMPAYAIQFNAVDDEGRLARPSEVVHFCEPELVFLKGEVRNCDPHQLQYQVLEVPAGRYTLSAFSYRSDRLTKTTNFVGRDADGPDIASDGTPLFDRTDPPKLGQRLLFPNRSFTVGPGEIVTIGDMSIDASVIPAQIVMTRNDDGALYALWADRRVPTEPVFRPVFGP